MGSSLFILLAATLAIAKPSAAAEKKRDIRIVEIEGSVWIRQGNQREWAPIKLEEGFWPTEEGDAIKTGPAPSRAVLQMDKDNTVEIGHHTIFEMVGSALTSDLKVGLNCLAAGGRGAKENALINLELIKDEGYRHRVFSEVDALVSRLNELSVGS